MADVKVNILEIEGVELDGPTEYELLAADVPVDTSNIDLTSPKLQGAVEELANRHFGKDAVNSSVQINDSKSGNSWKLYADLVSNVSDTSGTNTYRINCDFLWGHDRASNDIRVRARVDGSTEKEIRIEPKDQGTDQRIQNNLLFYLSNLSAGNHTIELQYRPASSSRTSRMYRADLEAWRTK